MAIAPSHAHSRNWRPASWFWIGLIIVGILAISGFTITWIVARDDASDSLPAHAPIRWASIGLSGIAVLMGALTPWLRRRMAQSASDHLGDFCALAAIVVLSCGGLGLSAATSALAKPSADVEGQP